MPWIIIDVRIVLGQTFGAALVVFPRTKYYHSIAWRCGMVISLSILTFWPMDWSWIYVIIPIIVRLCSTPRRPICRIWIFPMGPTSLRMGINSQWTRNRQKMSDPDLRWPLYHQLVFSRVPSDGVIVLHLHINILNSSFEPISFQQVLRIHKQHLHSKFWITSK